MQLYRYHERKVHGSFEFPMQLYHIDSKHPQYVMPVHWHVETEIVHVSKGQLQLFLNERQYSLNAGETAIVSGGVLHSAMPQDCAYECLVFNAELLRRLGLHELDGPDGIGGDGMLLREYYPADMPEVEAMVCRLFAALEVCGKAYKVTALGLLCQLWGYLLQNGHYSQNPGKALTQSNKLKNVLRMIEREYPNKITLDDMAAWAGMSPKYFCRFFQQMTHRTPIDYLNYYRVERACTELEKGGKNITEVAYESGFNDLSYFIRTLKKYKGCTPGQYVKKVTRAAQVYDF